MWRICVWEALKESVLSEEPADELTDAALCQCKAEERLYRKVWKDEEGEDTSDALEKSIAEMRSGWIGYIMRKRAGQP